MGKYKFTVVDQQVPLNDSNGNSGLLSRSLSMYEVSTAKTLKGEISKSILAEHEPEIFYACHNNWFVIAIDSDIHLFDMSVGCTELSPDSSRGRIENKIPKDKRLFAIPDDTRVVALRFIPSSEVMMMVLDDGTVIFSNPTKRLLHKYKALPPIEKCSLDIVTNSKEYFAAITDRKGSVYFVAISKFDAGIRDEEEFSRIFSTVKVVESLNNGSSAHFIVNVANAFLFFPKKKGETVYTSSTHSLGCSKLSQLFVLNEDVQMVRRVGCFIAILMSRGKIVFLDQNLIQIHALTLLNKEESECDVLDFEFLDLTDYCEFNSNLKILLKVKMLNGVEFKIKQFNEQTIQFSTTCSEHAVLIPISTPGDENNIIYIDAFPSNSPQDIFVRFVGEAQPALRLKKLIDLKRFDEALEFAKSYNLSLDLVYTELISHYQERIQTAENGIYEEETFTEMVRNLKLLSDNNIAGDHCIAALNFVNQYQHIKLILEFAKGLKITDEYTQNELSRFRYELASYRMVFGSENARYDHESHWASFLSSTNHKEFFDQFCEMGKISEARILFSRYTEISQKLHEDGAIKKLLEVFKAAIMTTPSLCEMISEFLESDLISLFLYSDVKNIKTASATICDFFIDVSALLEQIEPKSFPHKSLYFTETFNRAIDLLRVNCRSSDQYVGFLHILKQLDEEGQESPTQRLNAVIRNLTNLCRIHSVYQCALSYSEYLTHNINSICYRIMDKVRTVSSVREHIEQFVFPYIQEHDLDRNEMLHAYIKQLANSYYSGTGSQPNNTWDLLCLQITEQITDVNVRCKAIIEIASGTVPPWSPQLSNVIKNIMVQGEKIDPELIKSLRRQCLYADLGQIFISYQIPLNARSRVIGGAGLKSLLQFVFKNSNQEMGVKLQDSFRIIEIYEKLQAKSIFSHVDCYFFYALVLVQQFTEETEIKPLMDLFQLIKSTEETKTLAWQLVSYFKCLLKPTKIKAVMSQRMIWLSCLLCVIERYLPDGPHTRKLIRDTRAIRKLQEIHQIIIGFESLREKNECLGMLAKYIDTPNEKSVVEVVNFGKLLGLELREICDAIISAQIKNGLPDAALNTLRYLVSTVQMPTKLHLVVALDTCTYVCWKLTDSVKDETINERRIEFSRVIIHAFKSVLPRLIDWAISLQQTLHAESFMKISRYVALFDLVFEQCAHPNEEATTSSSSTATIKEPLDASTKSVLDCPKEPNKLYSTKPRLGILLPHQEGAMYDSASVVKAISIVAASLVEPPVESQCRDEFNEQMCESWGRLFVLLSGSHVLLEIQARQLARSLACFNPLTNRDLIALDRHVTELCKKIFSFPIADLQLAAHLLSSLTVDEMRKTLQELRRWIQTRKNVRFTLNLISVSLFMIIVTGQELSMIKQVASWLETTQWQKRLFKQGINMGTTQLKRDNIYELIGEFAKVLLPSSFLKDYCEEAHCTISAVLLNYFIELCKLSSTVSDSTRFKLCIETAKATIKDVNSDEKTMLVLLMTLKDICPYNYEAIELLLNKLHEIVSSAETGHDSTEFGRVKDACVLLNFLRVTKREKNIIPGEIRWYKHFTNQRNYDTSMACVSTELISPDESAAGIGGPLSDSTLRPLPQQSKQSFQSNEWEMNLPKSATKRMPFHLLFNEDNEAEKFQTKFVYHELTILNVQHWITLVEETKIILQHSRSHLLVGAINNHVNETVKYKRELTSGDLAQIRMLIFESHSRLSILKALASRFQRLALSNTKIGLMKLCAEVIEEWINRFDQLKIPAKELETYKSYSIALRESLAVFETEFLLEQYGVLNADTAVLTQKPQELVNHLLCSNKVDWTQTESITRCFDIITGVSKIHSVDLEGIFLGLIDHWIPGHDQLDQQSIAQIATDPDSTIDFTGSSSVVMNSVNAEEADYIVPVLYDDAQTTRIIVLLQKINDPLAKINELSRKYETDVSILPGGYMTKVRIASCILRFLSDEQMQNMFKISVNQFCGNLVNMLNQRLYSICRVDTPVKDLQMAEKQVEFVRSILSPQSVYRQTPEVAHLLVCLIVDNDLDDLSILGKAAQRLVQLRLSKPLMELLKYLRGIKGKDIKTIPNLPTYFGKTFEALFDKLDFTANRKQVLTLIYFLISCPVEGEGHFTRSISLLNAAGAQNASALVALSANATSDVNFTREGKNSDCELKLY